MKNKDYVLSYLGELKNKVKQFTEYEVDKWEQRDSITVCNYEVVKEDVDYIIDLVEKCF